MSAGYVGAPDAAGDFILRDVTVVDVTGGSHAAGQDVRVSGGTIAHIGATGPDTAGITVVEGNGAFVVPGYVDCHAHVLNDAGGVAGAYALMLANGVTGFRQMNGSPRLLRDRQEGRLPAPPGAPALLAMPGALLTPLNSANRAAVEAEVRAQHKQGADFIKAAMTGRVEFLAALAEAGLAPLAILQAATAAPARFLGLSAEAGRVAPGYRADLVLLASDPAESHRALRDITAVVRAGQLWSRASLDAVLAQVEASPTTR